MSKTAVEISTPTIIPTNYESMTKEELVAMANSFLLPLTDPEKYKEMVKQAIPDLVKEMNTKEDMASSIFESGQEMILVIIDCLKRYHNFSDAEIKKFHNEITDVLTGVKEFEDSGLSILSPHSIAVVGDKVEEKGITGLLQQIAEIRYRKNQFFRTGLELPNELEGSKLDKALQKPRQ